MVEEVLKYTLPALFTFLATYLVMHKFLVNERLKLKSEAVRDNHKIIAPLRLQAYERMVLLLERIQPNALVMRCQQEGLSCSDFQLLMLKTIRSEFDHNLTQQLYISDNAWEQVRMAKDGCVILINRVALLVKSDQPSIHLSKLILETMMTEGKDPTVKALACLKDEIRELF